MQFSFLYNTHNIWIKSMVIIIFIVLYTFIFHLNKLLLLLYSWGRHYSVCIFLFFLFLLHLLRIKWWRCWENILGFTWITNRHVIAHWAHKWTVKDIKNINNGGKKYLSCEWFLSIYWPLCVVYCRCKDERSNFRFYFKLGTHIVLRWINKLND